MALNVRKTQHTDADTARMVKDIVDFDHIVPSDMMNQILNSFDAMSAIASSVAAMRMAVNSSDLTIGNRDDYTLPINASILQAYLFNRLLSKPAQPLVYPY